MSTFGVNCSVSGNVNITDKLNIGSNFILQEIAGDGVISASTGIIRSAGGTINFGSDILLTTGNVGIGTNILTYPLNIYQNNGGYGEFKLIGNTQEMLFGCDTSGARSYIQARTTAPVNNNLVLQPNGGNVGIGTTTPYRSFTIAGTSNSLIDFNPSSFTHFTIGSDEKGFIIYDDDTGGVEGYKFVINSSGNVGIGNSTPSTKLHVGSGDIGIDRDQKFDFGAGYGSNWTMKQASSNNFLYIERTGGGNEMTIDTSGNVGIGIATPLRALHVSNTTWPQSIIAGASQSIVAGEYLSVSTLGGHTAAISAWSKLHINDGADVSICRTSGNVGIGTITPSYKLDVYQTANTITQYIRSTHASFASNSLIIDVTRAQATAYNFASFRSSAGGDYEFIFRGDGNAYADGGWNTPAADYAEYFESLNGDKIDLGKCVVIDNTHNNKISKVREYDKSIDKTNDILGVVRAKKKCRGGIVGNNHDNKWKEKYLTNDFGEYLYEDYYAYEWIDENDKEHSYNIGDVSDDIIVPNDVKTITLERRIKNPEYNEEFKYIPYEDRDEKILVALMGQIPKLKTEPMKKEWKKCYDISDNVDMVYIK